MIETFLNLGMHTYEVSGLSFLSPSEYHSNPSWHNIRLLLTGRRDTLHRVMAESGIEDFEEFLPNKFEDIDDENDRDMLVFQDFDF